MLCISHIYTLSPATHPSFSLRRIVLIRLHPQLRVGISQ
ncbi:hypothetical protein A2U01_0065084, partial [Trifolium medium]|nr:hypothetical protein [Trifolium medium]